MPNRKTHFIAGALVGATVNVIIQTAEMAMDYDRPFDWGEFFLCTGAGAFAGLVPDLLDLRPVQTIANFFIAPLLPHSSPGPSPANRP